MVSRGVDLLLSPLKLLLASSKALCDGALGLMTGDEDFGLIKGFKRFYKDWAEARDDIENEFWGRETKDEKIERLIQLKNEKIAERKRLIEERKQKEQFSIGRERESFKYLLAELRYLKPDSDTSQYDNYYKWNYEKLLRNA